MGDFKFDNGNTLKDLVKSRIKSLGIRLNQNLGQHFLIDEASIELMVQSVNLRSTVIEIGPGVGQLTEVLAERASRVIAVEIDRRFEPVLAEIIKRHPNVQVIFGDAIALKLQDLIPKKKELEEVQIVASLPFHITEPFLHKIAGLPIESATLAVGQRLVWAIQAESEESAAFGQLTLLAQTFFDIEELAIIERRKFFPVPRTDSVIIRLTPRKEQEFRANKRDFLLRRLLRTTSNNPLVKNCLKEGLIEFELKTGGKTLTQNQARAIIEKIEIPDSVLNKPFGQLSNSELRILSKRLQV